MVFCRDGLIRRSEGESDRKTEIRGFGREIRGSSKGAEGRWEGRGWGTAQQDGKRQDG